MECKTLKLALQGGDLGLDIISSVLCAHLKGVGPICEMKSYQHVDFNTFQAANYIDSVAALMQLRHNLICLRTVAGVPVLTKICIFINTRQHLDAFLALKERGQCYSAA
jgi:hypothetical protein